MNFGGFQEKAEKCKILSAKYPFSLKKIQKALAIIQLFKYTACIRADAALLSSIRKACLSTMKQKEISALSLEIISRFFDGVSQPLIDHLGEDVLWLGPRDGQFYRGKETLRNTLQQVHEQAVYTLGNMSTQLSPVGKKGLNVVLFYDVLAHLPDGTSVLTRQRTLLAWEEQKIRSAEDEETVPRLTMIMTSNAHVGIGSKAPFETSTLLTKAAAEGPAELPKRILVRGMNDESHYLDAEGIIYIESSDSSHHSLIHTVDGVLPCLDKVTNLAEKYSDSFLRSHASYLVNPYYVRSLKRFSLTLTDGTTLPVPEKKYTAFKKLLNQWAENH